MKIQKKLNKIPLILTALVMLLIFIGVGIYLATTQNSNKAATTSSKEEQTNLAGDQAKKETIDETIVDSGSSSTGTDKGQQGPAAKDTASIIITASSQNDSNYQIRTLISAVVTGNCTLTLTKGSSTVSKTTDISTFAQSSTCKGFDIPLTELSKGTWTVNIKFESADVSGETSAEIEVK